jgi:MFS family permease
VILTGVAGIALSMFSLGLARTFSQAVIARSLNGALNGNIGVLKSHFASLFGTENIAEAYAYLPIAWSLGAAVGPLIGGGLAHPAERFPSTGLGALFTHEFWRSYPYFLPCAVSGGFAVFAWSLTFFCLRETVIAPVSMRQLLRLRMSKPNLVLQNVVEGVDPSVTEDVYPLREEDRGKPLPLREVLTRNVLVAGGNYALLSVLDIMFRAILPLFLSTPRELGGLGLSPPKIGSVSWFLGKTIRGLFNNNND